MKTYFNKIVLFIVSMGLLLGFGCTSSDIFTPDKLPDATLMQPYYQKINIGFNLGPIRQETFSYTVQPEDSGLVLTATEPNKYNYLILEGTPQKRQDITLYIKARTYGTNMQSGNKIEKTYIIKVKPAE